MHYLCYLTTKVLTLSGKLVVVFTYWDIEYVTVACVKARAAVTAVKTKFLPDLCIKLYKLSGWKVETPLVHAYRHFMKILLTCMIASQWRHSALIKACVQLNIFYLKIFLTAYLTKLLLCSSGSIRNFLNASRPKQMFKVS